MKTKDEKLKLATLINFALVRFYMPEAQEYFFPVQYSLVDKVPRQLLRNYWKELSRNLYKEQIKSCFKFYKIRKSNLETFE